jgi:hypothetical protein
MLHLKLLEKEEQAKPKIIRREITKLMKLMKERTLYAKNYTNNHQIKELVL